MNSSQNELINFAELSEEDRDNKELILKMLDKNALGIFYVSKRLQNDSDCLKKVIDNEGIIFFLVCKNEIINDDIEIYKKIIKNGTTYFDYIPDKIKENRNSILELIETNPMILWNGPKKYLDDDIVMKKAININPNIYRYASNRIRDKYALMALKKDINLWVYITGKSIKNRRINFMSNQFDGCNLDYKNQKIIMFNMYHILRFF